MAESGADDRRRRGNRRRAERKYRGRLGGPGLRFLTGAKAADTRMTGKVRGAALAAIGEGERTQGPAVLQKRVVGESRGRRGALLNRNIMPEQYTPFNIEFSRYLSPRRQVPRFSRDDCPRKSWSGGNSDKQGDGNVQMFA